MNSIDIRGTIAMSLRDEVVTTPMTPRKVEEENCNEPQIWGSYDKANLIVANVNPNCIEPQRWGSYDSYTA